MGIEEKLAGAKKTSWLGEGLSDVEIKTIVELAKISARIERCRLEKGMTQSEFADYMGVSQGMISKWESREYNFTIRSLNEICNKNNLEFYISLEKKVSKTDYKIIKWDEEKVEKNKNKNNWIKNISNKEAIA